MSLPSRDTSPTNDNNRQKRNQKLKIPIFSGEPGESVEALLKKIDRYCVLHNKDEKWKIDCIQFYLSGRAFEQYDCMSDEEKNDYPTVCRLLRRYFAVAPLPSALA